MPTRRQFMQAGLSAAMLGLLRRTGYGAPGSAPGTPPGGLPAGLARPAPLPLRPSRPLIRIPASPASVVVDGLPFEPLFTGDAFPSGAIPFHSPEDAFPGGILPRASETVDIAIVGGGLSGLTTAYLLREHRPVLFELQDRFGGVSKGEIWDETPYSMGGAYFITPDAGTFLESFYQELGLDKVYRYSAGGADPIELGGSIYDGFWQGQGMSKEDIRAFERYAEIVLYFAENYPDIPLPKGKDVQWILDLDIHTLHYDLEQRMGMPIPPLLAAAIQGYCYSSFGAGWDDISAASGWNFIAAEEFGRWVCPGGNAWVTDVLWQRLVDFYSSTGERQWQRYLRPGTRVVDVRPSPDKDPRTGEPLIHVSIKDESGVFGALTARRVVMACSKHICKHMMHDIQKLDLDKYNAMQTVITNPYVVANVLLTEPVPLDFYDLFLLGEPGTFPMTKLEVAKHSMVTDVLSGDYALSQRHLRSVLSLYWPLPWGHAVFELLVKNAWWNYASALAPQVKAALDILKVPHSAVRQIRMARWGHAMPIARPGMIADGTCEELRRPYLDHVYFVNQDNWMLPAFETCLLEAQTMSEQIAASL